MTGPASGTRAAKTDPQLNGTAEPLLARAHGQLVCAIVGCPERPEAGRTMSRTCEWPPCGGSLDGLRRDARFCSADHRRLANLFALVVELGHDPVEWEARSRRFWRGVEAVPSGRGYPSRAAFRERRRAA